MGPLRFCPTPNEPLPINHEGGQNWVVVGGQFSVVISIFDQSILMSLKTRSLRPPACGEYAGIISMPNWCMA
jgi:hypothetical protein